MRKWPVSEVIEFCSQIDFVVSLMACEEGLGSNCHLKKTCWFVEPEILMVLMMGVNMGNMLLGKHSAA